MKTKKISLFLLAAGLIMSASSFGQGLYLGVGGGYGFAAGRSDFSPDQNTTGTITNNSTSYTSRTYSLGKGVNLGIYGGYMFNKNIGAELGISYLIGGTTSSINQSDVPNNSYTSTVSIKGSMLRLVPTLRLQVGENKLHPYAKAGLIIGVAGKAIQETKTTSGNNTDDDIWTYTGGSSFGFHGAIGVMYMVSDMIGIYGELAGNFQQASPSKGELTTSTSNGIDNIPNKTTNQKEITYSSSYTDDGTNPPNSPKMQTLIHIPFSSFGFNIGVHFAFGGK